MVIFGILLVAGVLPARVRRGDRACATSCTSTPPASSGLSDAPHHRPAHPLPSCGRPIIIQAAIIAGIAIAIQAGLDFLGLGDPAMPTWGGDAERRLRQHLQGAAAHALARPGDRPHVASRWCCSPTRCATCSSARSSCDAGAPRGRHRTGSVAAVATSIGAVTARPTSRRRAGQPIDTATTTGPRPAPARSLLSVTDLRVGYDQADGSIKRSCTGSRSTIRRGEVHGLIGESGSGKTQTAFAVLRPAARAAAGSRPAAIEFEGTRPRRRPRTSDMTADPRAAHRLHPAGADVATSTRRSRSAASWSSRCASPSGSARRRPPSKALGAARPGRHPRPEAHVRRLPARGLRRHGAARAHRRRRLLRPRPAHRRRADHGPRRHRAGRGARPAARPAGRAPHGACSSSPTTSASSPTCATGSRSCRAAASSRPARCARSSPTRSTRTPESLLAAILEDGAPAARSPPRRHQHRPPDRSTRA